MAYLTIALRSFLFLVLFLFALKNYEPVALRFYFDLEWRAPLVLLLLVFFAAGVVVGLLALLPGFLRQRREIAVLAAGARRSATSPVHPSAPRDAAP